MTSCLLSFLKKKSTLSGKREADEQFCDFHDEPQMYYKILYRKNVYMITFYFIYA